MFAGGQAHSTHPATGALHDPSRISTAKAHREISRGKSGVHLAPRIRSATTSLRSSTHDLVLQRNSDAGCHPTPERAPKSSVCFERHILIEKLTGW
jgi:hypothetical protein